MSKNVNFYEKNNGEYIDNTIDLNMRALHKFLFKNITPGSKVLDIGFGSGREMIFLKEKLGCEVVRLDISSLFVEKAKEKGLDVYESDMSNILDILEENSFDAIISVAMLFHMQETERKILYNDLKKVLKPKGYFITSVNEVDRSNDPDRDFYLMSCSRENSILKISGFDLLDTEVMADATNRFDWVTSKYILN